MTLGPTAFAVVLWGAVLAVLAVFAYEVYAIAVDLGWLDPLAADPAAGPAHGSDPADSDESDAAAGNGGGSDAAAGEAGGSDAPSGEDDD